VREAVAGDRTVAPPIVCTLDPAAARAQVGEWSSVLRSVVTREPIPGGLRLRFGADAPLGAVARLAIAERACCSFFTFTVVRHDRGMTLEVTAPVDAQSLVEDLFGAPATEVSAGRT
jgi:hypothetical protein